MSSCFHYLPMNPLPDGVPEYYLVNGLNVEFNLSSVEDDLIALRELAHHNGVELNEFVMYDHSGNMVTYSKQGNSKWITRVQSKIKSHLVLRNLLVFSTKLSMGSTMTMKK